ncbi:N-acetyltransferase [Pseudoscourfieldia marina]
MEEDVEGGGGGGVVVSGGGGVGSGGVIVGSDGGVSGGGGSGGGGGGGGVSVSGGGNGAPAAAPAPTASSGGNGAPPAATFGGGGNGGTLKGKRSGPTTGGCSGSAPKAAKAMRGPSPPQNLSAEQRAAHVAAFQGARDELKALRSGPFELPGHAGLPFTYEIVDYTDPSEAKEALPWFFESFPGEELQEYMEYVVTAQGGWGDEYEDFRGFRVVLGRYSEGCGGDDNNNNDVVVVDANMGTCDDEATGSKPSPKSATATATAVTEAPSQETSPTTTADAATTITTSTPPKKLPAMRLCGADAAAAAKHAPVVTAAAIRVGPGFLECPFFATAPEWRGRGQARYLIESIECIGRELKCHTFTLCAAENPAVRRVWRRLGFKAAPVNALTMLHAFPMDIVMLRNSSLLWKFVPEPEWRTLVMKWNGVVRMRCEVDARSARLKSRDVLQAKAAAKYAMAAVRKEQLRDRGRDIE